MTWSNFLKRFIFQKTLKYQKYLKIAIFRRVQKPHQNGRDFILNLQTLIRRHGGWRKTQELSCINKHLLQDYQYSRRNNLNPAADLLDQVQKYESLAQELKTNKSEPKNCMVTTLN